MKLNQWDLTRCELHDMLEISHDAMGINSDQDMHDLLLRVSCLVPCDSAIAILGKTDMQGTLNGVAKLVNAGYPTKWLEIYVENDYATVDPVLISHFRHFKPRLWSDIYKSVASEPEFYFIEHAGSYGLCEGITLGRRNNAETLGSLFSFAGANMGEHPRHTAVLAHLTPHLHVALMRTAFSRVDPLSLLSAREREVLQWMIEGKSNWETAHILGIAERTVKFHVKNILAKLQSSTRVQAIAHALKQDRLDGPLSSLETWLASVCSRNGNIPNPESRLPILRQLEEAP